MITIHDPRKVAPRDLKRPLWAIAAAVAVLCLCKPASARTLEVGPDQNLKAPSAAAAIAAPGDTIEIAPGEYFDCAVWSEDNLTIEGKGDGAVITDKTCQGKALFITKGNDITIRNLTFTRARVPDQNGAGIRVEGKNLTIEHSRFIDNEDGILAGDSPQSRIIDQEQRVHPQWEVRKRLRARRLYRAHRASPHRELQVSGNSRRASHKVARDQNRIDRQ